LNDEPRALLTDPELKSLFDELFPHGFAGPDVLAEIAPEGWEKSPLLACFHPSPEQVFKEQVQVHRNLEELFRHRPKPEPNPPAPAPRPEPTLREVQADWKETAMNTSEELTELVGQCLWDVFSDNHEVVAADGRVADIGSFRGSSAFLDEYLAGNQDPWREGDCMRFYPGTIWTSARADLTPVYSMIFRRLRALGADWEYHFPELGVVDLSPLRDELKKEETYSPSEAFGQEQEERVRREELERMRAALAAAAAQARREAMDRLPPPTVRAYQDIFDRDPPGWPPA
jgi:hypothetical protein